MIRIATDCDGVLANNFSYWEQIAKREGVTEPFNHKYNGIYKVRCSDGEIFGNKLFGEYRDEWIKNSSPFHDVVETTNKINAHPDMKWWLVTSRGEDVKKQTLEWLQNNGITGFEDTFFIENKTASPCNVIIDDHPKHIEAYQNAMRMGILMDRPYNQQFTCKHRVYSLTEAYNKLCDL